MEGVARLTPLYAASNARLILHDHQNRRLVGIVVSPKE
jgi:hypothetical protein